jgi:hypothetical protein
VFVSRRGSESRRKRVSMREKDWISRLEGSQMYKTVMYEEEQEEQQQ